MTEIKMPNRKLLAHIVVWGIMLAFPYLILLRGGSNLQISSYLLFGSFWMGVWILVFYINYLWLVPQYILKQRIQWFFLLNIVIILSFSLGFHFWGEHMFSYFLDRFPEEAVRYREQFNPEFRPPIWVEVIRDSFPLFIIAIIATLIKLNEEWRRSETSRKEAEKALAEAELQNLRSQLNPHFLLNTLNNIYALIAFDTDKAQESVQELSKLLRHVLYDNREQFTTLSKEMEFIQSYIELMRIRLSSNVKVETEYDLSLQSQTQIAPLIFISLVENAFKHGISPTEPSYIRIRFSETQGCVRCLIQNSNHRKVGYDKSGSGIGLEQVRKRLDLTYPGKYKWNYGLSNDGKEYSSSLEIYTN
ncbi:MAG: histidine kinase [Bacteroidaceae bacterium]|nr:histidine kinase [Bacteroidaceae bacterium]